MIFTNIHTFSVVISILLFCIWGCFLLGIYRKQKSKISVIFLWIIFLLLLISLLWPRGWVMTKNQSYIWTNIVFLVDVSTSMNALDFDNQSASRLDISRYTISQFIESHPNNKYALDVFSGDAVKLLPFTNDQSIYQTALSGITQSNVWTPWTDIVWALEASISHFDSDDSGLIVMLTDGWDDPIESIWELKDMLTDKNIEILIVWVGSEKWSYIPAGTDVFGRTLYKIYNGEKVVTRLNSEELESISNTLWIYKKLDRVSDIENIIDTISWLWQEVSFTNDMTQRRNLSLIFILLWGFLWILFLWSMIFSNRKKK